MNPFCPECLSTKTSLGLPKRPEANLLHVTRSGEKKGYWRCKKKHYFKRGRDSLDYRVNFPRGE